MLGIPFLSNFIEKTVQKQLVADNVDYLNYYVTSLLLAFASLAISAKQYFGSPIQCWVPNEFKGGWEKYAEDYCFIANSYYVPFEEDIPNDPKMRKDHISYYRWVPIVLAIQAFFFYVPNWIWNALHRQTAINPTAFLMDAEKVSSLIGDEREREMKGLAEYFMQTVGMFGHTSKSIRHRTSPRSGYNATILYLMTKLCYVLNIIFQMVLLNKFLGEDFIHWGYQVAADVASGREWEGTHIFPRVILCDFDIRKLGGGQHKYTVQCVIMMNMINEKLYLFLYFWFLLVGIVTFLNCGYFLIVMMVPQLRSRLLNINYDPTQNRHINLSRREIERFTYDCLRPDGVLLLQFVREHVGGRTTFDLVNKLLELYSKGSASSDSMSEESLGKHSSSPMEKYPKLPRYSHSILPQKHEYYPHLRESNEKVFESAPHEGYMDQGTMKLIDKPTSCSPTNV